MIAKVHGAILAAFGAWGTPRKRSDLFGRARSQARGESRTADDLPARNGASGRVPASGVADGSSMSALGRVSALGADTAH